MKTATNVVSMPEPPDNNASSDALAAGAGHRSTQKASAAQKPMLVGKTESESPAANAAEPSTEVFAVFGVEPEIQAYAMAKYTSELQSRENLVCRLLLEKTGVCDFEVFAFIAVDEGVAARDQLV